METKTHDMEAMVASRRGNALYSTELKKDKVEFWKNVKFSKNPTKEAMPIPTNELIWITKKPKLED